MIRKFFSAAALLVTLAAPVAQANPTELGPYLDIGLQHVPSDKNDRLADDAWGVFAGGGVPINKWFALEGDMFYDRFNRFHNDPASSTWKEYGAEAAALLTLPVGNGWVPFFSGGVGVTQSRFLATPTEKSVDMAYALGAGTFYLFNAFDRNWGLRFDARYRITALSDAPFGGSITGHDDNIGEAVFRFGVLAMFGGEPEPVVDADSDGDGVPDSKDKCPDTPAGVEVDADGCPKPQEVGAPVEPQKNTYGPVYFDFNKDNIKPAEAAKLDKALDAIGKMKNGKIVIQLDGHTDSFGTEQYNIGLGERRANAVKGYLLSHGAKVDDIMVTSYGETKPAADNDTAEGRAMNRRVEIFVTGE